MIEGNDYKIKTNAKGKPMFKVLMWWTDVDGGKHFTNTNDVDLTKDIVNLLTGEVTLADLLPVTNQS